MTADLQDATAAKSIDHDPSLLVIGPEGLYEKQRLTSQQQTRRSALLGLSFGIVIAAYGTGISYTTTLYPIYGFYTLGILNIMFAVGSFLSPFVSGKLKGDQRVMLIGIWGYTIYLVALITNLRPLLLVSAAITGTCAGYSFSDFNERLIELDRH